MKAIAFNIVLFSSIIILFVTNVYASTGAPVFPPNVSFIDNLLTEITFSGKGIQPCSSAIISMNLTNGGVGNTVDSYTFDQTIADDGTFLLPIIEAYDVQSVVGDVDYVVMLRTPQLTPEASMARNRSILSATLVDPSTINLPCISAAEALVLQCPGVPGIDVPAATLSPVSETYLMASEHLKIQFEDLGSNPGGKWLYVDAPDSDGNQDNFQGSGYYIWGSSASTAVDLSITPGAGLTYNFFVPSGQEGEYSIRLHTSRDPGALNSYQDDIWMSVNGDITSNVPPYLPALSVEGTGSYVNFYGVYLAQCTQFNARTMNYATYRDDDPDPDAIIELGSGLNEITFHGRSEGYHIDFFEIYRGVPPAINAPDSGYY